MPSFDHRFEHRRRLLQWLSASPLLASPGFSFAGVDRPSKLPELEASAPLIGKPEEAINVFDFEPVFFKNVPMCAGGTFLRSTCSTSSPYSSRTCLRRTSATWLRGSTPRRR